MLSGPVFASGRGVFRGPLSPDQAGLDLGREVQGNGASGGVEVNPAVPDRGKRGDQQRPLPLHPRSAYLLKQEKIFAGTGLQFLDRTVARLGPGRFIARPGERKTAVGDDGAEFRVNPKAAALCPTAEVRHDVE